MNNHFYVTLFSLSITSAYAMELPEVGEESAQNPTIELCAAIKNISHDPKGVTAWAQLQSRFAHLTDLGEKASIAHALRTASHEHKKKQRRYVAPLVKKRCICPEYGLSVQYLH